MSTAPPGSCLAFRSVNVGGPAVAAGERGREEGDGLVAGDVTWLA